MPRYNCRICWNSAGWNRPTGEAAKLEVRSYVATHGFGHEEWLLNREWLINGVKYTHLQPVARSQRRFEGTTIDLALYTIGPRGVRFAVGTLDGAYVLTPSEATSARNMHVERGWLASMQQDLRAIDANANMLTAGDALSFVNVSFNPDDVRLYDPMDHLVTDDPRFPANSRYSLTESLILPPKNIRTSPSRKLKKSLTAVRRPIAGSVIDLAHTRLQNALHELLGDAGMNVGYEADNIDLKIHSPEGDTLVELKTAPTARACIREALGQLLEYAHYAGRNDIAALVVVGQPAPTSSDLAYLRLLQEKYQLPLAYWQFHTSDTGPKLNKFSAAD